MNVCLERLPDLDELHEVIFNLNRNASTGPDGFTAKFYQAC